MARLMVEYKIDLQYHPSKVNVVPKTLSRQPLAMFLTGPEELIEDMRKLELEVVLRMTDNSA